MITSVPAREALARLGEGNRRYAEGAAGQVMLASHDRRRELLKGQKPFAAILGCSDSRVPVEIIFDQGPGELFVIRVAGNIVAPSQIGSIEYAAEHLGVRLVVVLGHTMCGAVQATLDELGRPVTSRSRNIHSIVDRIEPVVKDLMATDLRNNPDALVREAVLANVRDAAANLRNGSEIIRQLIREDGLLVVGARYSLDSGLVDFFDGVPEGW